MLGLTSRNEERAITSSDTGWGDWGDSSTTSWSGVTITRDTSMQLLAVHGSVRMISESIATLPADTYRSEKVRNDRGETDMRVPTRPPPWLVTPSNDLDWTSFVSQVLNGLLLDGNSYIQLSTGSDGQIRELIPLADSRVTVSKELSTKVIRVDGRKVSSGELLHIPGMMFPGAVVGLSPIEYARQTIGLGLAATEYWAGWFDRDGNMPGVIELPRIAQPDVMRKMARQWKAKRTRSGKGLPGVLDDGAQWKPTGVTSEQMQFLQTRKYSAGEIAGQLFLLDPTDLGIPVEGSSISYANLDQRNVRRVQVTFLPHIIRLERALTTLLPRMQFVKLNVDGILRGDAKSRYESYKIGIESGFLTIDEVREMEDRQPLPPAPEEAPVAEPPPAP